MTNDLEEWAESIAERYDILPRTVIELYENLEGRLYKDGRHLKKRERAEKFFELYFEGRNDNGNNDRTNTAAD